jgi:hypothetical protein
MSEPIGFECRGCGEWHDELPLSYRSDAPDYWSDDFDDDDDSDRNDDLCVIGGEHFFVQGNLNIDVTDTDETFSWGVWVSMSEADFGRMMKVWEEPGRESEPPYPGEISTDLPGYGASTLRLKAKIHTNPVGEKPWISLDPTDHPLAAEINAGMTMKRVQEIAELLLHG